MKSFHNLEVTLINSLNLEGKPLWSMQGHLDLPVKDLAGKADFGDVPPRKLGQRLLPNVYAETNRARAPVSMPLQFSHKP